MLGIAVGHFHIAEPFPTASGGWGNDRIDARDGAADSVDCGGQALDSAAVDLGVEASIIGCADVS